MTRCSDTPTTSLPGFAIGGGPTHASPRRAALQPAYSCTSCTHRSTTRAAARRSAAPVGVRATCLATTFELSITQTMCPQHAPPLPAPAAQAVRTRRIHAPRAHSEPRYPMALRFPASGARTKTPPRRSEASVTPQRQRCSHPRTSACVKHAPAARSRRRCSRLRPSRQASPDRRSTLTRALRRRRRSRAPWS